MKEQNENLDFAAFFLSLRAFDEIGDKAETAAGICEDGDGVSPSSQSLLRRVLVLHFEFLQ